MHSLKAKIILSTVLILSFAIGISTYMLLRAQEKQLLEGIKEKLNITADTIERSVSIAMREGRSDEVQSILEAVSIHKDISEVRILDEEGRILRSSNEKEIGLLLHSEEIGAFADERRGVMFLYEKQGDEPFLSRFKPIRNHPACYRCHDPSRKINGIFEVHLSLRDTYEKLAMNRRLSIIAAAVTILGLVLVINFLFLRLVNRPLDRLRKVMSRVEGGDLSARCKEIKEDEIGYLSQSFNSMVQQLEVAQEEIERHHQEQLQRADRLATVGELAAGIAHEIKSPLAGIAGAIQVISDDLSDENPQKEIFDEILLQIDRVNKTVGDLLDYARPRPPRFELANLNEIVHNTALVLPLAKCWEERNCKRVDCPTYQSVNATCWETVGTFSPGGPSGELAKKLGDCRKCEFYQKQHEAPRVTVRMDLWEAMPKISVDPDQIKQVLTNIMLNAIQAMDGGGVLAISTRLADEGRFLEVEISDTGCGMSEEVMSNAFKPFFTTKHRGSGLGLSICRRIVEDHRGSINVESELGKGTTFTIKLPLKQNT